MARKRRTFNDPVTGEPLDDPVAKTFSVTYEGPTGRNVHNIDTLTDNPTAAFFEKRLTEAIQTAPDKNVTVLDFKRIDPF